MWARHPLKHRFRTPVDVCIWDWRLRLMPRGNLSESRWLFLPRFVDRAERLFWQSHLAEDAVFLDIGANAGLYSFWVARCISSAGRVVAVEPDPQLQRRMRFNLQQNHLVNIELIPAALGATSGSARLVGDANNLGQNRVSTAPTNRANADDPALSKEVPVKTLLELCQQLGLARIDGLKIDIEGREHEVMAAFFATAPAALFPKWLQFERCTEAQARDMERLVREVGYRRVALGRMNAIYQWDRPNQQEATS